MLHLLSVLGDFDLWYSGYYLAGFPPIPGQKTAGAEQGFVAALMAVDKLISNDNVEVADEDDDEEEVGLSC